MADYLPLWDERELQVVRAVVESGRASMFSGQYTRRLEALLAVRHPGTVPVAVNSCTAGLHLALAAAGVSAGDEVLVPSFTYVATAMAPLYVNAAPVFTDIRRDCGTMDVESCRRLLSPKTRAVIFVHLFGVCEGIRDVATFCRNHGLILIEDCAQAMGTVYGGRPAGSWGEAACYSFFESKTVSVGEGGAVIFRSAEAASLARCLRHHGIDSTTPARWVKHMGFNYKPSELQSAVAVSQLERLEEIVAHRNGFADLVMASMAGMARFYRPGRSENVCWDKVCCRFGDTRARERALTASPPSSVYRYLVRPLPEEPVFKGCVADGTVPATRAMIDDHVVVQCRPRYDERAVADEMRQWVERIHSGRIPG